VGLITDFPADARAAAHINGSFPDGNASAATTHPHSRGIVPRLSLGYQWPNAGHQKIWGAERSAPPELDYCSISLTCSPARQACHAGNRVGRMTHRCCRVLMSPDRPRHASSRSRVLSVVLTRAI
jgi:hypothetical protein